MDQVGYSHWHSSNDFELLAHRDRTSQFILCTLLLSLTRLLSNTAIKPYFSKQVLKSLPKGMTRRISPRHTLQRTALQLDW